MIRPVLIALPEALLHGDLTLPKLARGLVIFAHGRAAAGIVRAIVSSPSKSTQRDPEPCSWTC
jgi:hypothetical protein